MVESETRPESLEQQAGTLGKLAGLLVRLTRQEIALFKAELNQCAQNLKKRVPLVILGVWLCHIALMATVGVAVVLLDSVLPLWGACAILAVSSGLVGVVLIKAGGDKLVESLKFEHTPESLETNLEFLKERIAS